MATQQAADAAPFTESERSDILEHRIGDLAAAGWIILSRVATAAQLGQQERGLLGAFRPEGGFSKVVYVRVTATGQTEMIHSNGNREALPPPRRLDDLRVPPTHVVCTHCGRSNPVHWTICGGCRGALSA